MFGVFWLISMDEHVYLYPDHLVCTRCGAIADITFTDMTQQIEEFLGTAIDSYDLQVRYLCPKCRGQH